MHVLLLLISHWQKPAMWPNPNARGGEVKFYHEPKRYQKYLVDSPANCPWGVCYNTPPNVYTAPQIKNFSYLHYLTGDPQIKICFIISILKPRKQA